MLREAGRRERARWLLVCYQGERGKALSKKAGAGLVQ